METECEPWKWGTYQTYVVPKDGKFYQFTVLVHHYDGWQVDSDEEIEAYEVEKKEIVTTQWVMVEDENDEQ